MNIRDKLNAFLNRIYVPFAKMETFVSLQQFVNDVRIRSPNKRDAHQNRLNVLLIHTRGKGLRETFESWETKFIDFDNIGEKYALAYVYDDEGNGSPQRIDITSCKNLIIL